MSLGLSISLPKSSFYTSHIGKYNRINTKLIDNGKHACGIFIDFQKGFWHCQPRSSSH